MYPYWTHDSYEPPWSLLTHLCWHSVGINSDGTIYNPNDWPSSAPVERTHNNGVNFTLSVTNFNSDSLDSLLYGHAEDVASNLLSSVREGGADGVALDFEGIRETNTISGTPNKDLLKDLLEEVHTVFTNDDPRYTISLWLPPYDWQHVYTHPDLPDFVDSFLLMGYNYHNKGSGSTGPVGPLSDPDGTDIESALNSTSHGYTRTIPMERIVLVAPWYGIKWPASGPEKGAATQGSGTSVFIKSAVPEAANCESLWDDTSGTPWYRYLADGQWYQCWYENSRSFRDKADYAVNNGMLGLGMWAMGYEGSRRDVWDVVEEQMWGIRSVKVVIDPDGGYYWNGRESRWEWQNEERHGLREDTNNVLIARKLVEMLRVHGIEVHCTRELYEDAGVGKSGLGKWQEGSCEYLTDLSDYDPGSDADILDEERIRPYYANEIGADVLISIGSVSWEKGNRTEGGFRTVYGRTEESGDGDVKDMALAEAIHAGLSVTISDHMPDRGSVNEGTISEEPLHIFLESDMPSTVVCVGNLDNATDAGLLSSGDFIRRAAAGVFKGLAQYLSLQVDDSGPGVEFSSFPDGQNVQELTGITGSCRDESEISRVELRILRGPDHKCWNGTNWSAQDNWVKCEMVNGTSWEYTLLTGIGESNFLVTVRAWDYYYNMGTAPSVNVTVDATPPIISIYVPGGESVMTELSRARGTVDDVNSISVAELLVTDETTGLHRGIDGWGVQETWLSANLFDNGTWEYTFPFSFADGSYSLRIRCEDMAGNTAEKVEVSFAIRSMGPSIRIDHPTHGERYTECPLFSGSVDSEIQVKNVSLSLRNGGDGQFLGQGSNWSREIYWFDMTMITEWMWEFQLSCPLKDGIYIGAVRITDGSGNTYYSHDRSFSIDSTPPELEISYPVNGSSMEYLDNISGTIFDQSPVDFLEMTLVMVIDGTYWNGTHWAGGVTWLVPVMVPDGNWFLEFDVPLETGRYSVALRAGDVVGNVNTERRITFDISKKVRQIRSFFPRNNELNVSVDTDVVVYFSVEMDGVSVAENLLFIPEMEAAVSWNGNHTEMTLSPSGRLSYGTEYFLIILKGAADITGDEFDNSFFLRFITEEYGGNEALLLGTVRDANDRPLTNATVELRGPKMISLITDANGHFNFDQLPAGTGYELIVSKEGVGVGRWKFDLSESEVKDMGNLYLREEIVGEKKASGGVGVISLLIIGIFVIVLAFLLGWLYLRSRKGGKRKTGTKKNEGERSEDKL